LTVALSPSSTPGSRFTTTRWQKCEPKTAKSRRSVAVDPLTVAVLCKHWERVQRLGQRGESLVTSFVREGGSRTTLNG
jgi:hypothetical protein